MGDKGIPVAAVEEEWEVVRKEDANPAAADPEAGGGVAAEPEPQPEREEGEEEEEEEAPPPQPRRDLGGPEEEENLINVRGFILPEATVGTVLFAVSLFLSFIAMPFIYTGNLDAHSLQMDFENDMHAVEWRPQQKHPRFLFRLLNLIELTAFTYLACTSMTSIMGRGREERDAQERGRENSRINRFALPVVLFIVCPLLLFLPFLFLAYQAHESGGKETEKMFNASHFFVGMFFTLITIVLVFVLQAFSIKFNQAHEAAWKQAIDAIASQSPPWLVRLVQLARHAYPQLSPEVEIPCLVAVMLVCASSLSMMSVKEV